MREIPSPVLPELGRGWPRGPFIVPFKISRGVICSSQTDSCCYRSHCGLSGLIITTGVVVGVTQVRRMQLERG
jgi:hypothetical protein